MRGYRSVSVAGSQVRQFRAQSRRQTKTGTSFYNISRSTMLTEAKKMSLTPQSRWLGYEIEGSTPSQGLSWQATDWAPRVARNRVHKWYPRLKNFDFIFLIKLIFLDCFFFTTLAYGLPPQLGLIGEPRDTTSSRIWVLRLWGVFFIENFFTQQLI